MENKELDLWREEDGERVGNFFAALEAEEAVRERIQAKTLTLAQAAASRRLPRLPRLRLPQLRWPLLRYIAAACALVLVCTVVFNLAAGGGRNETGGGGAAAGYVVSNDYLVEAAADSAAPLYDEGAIKGAQGAREDSYSSVAESYPAAPVPAAEAPAPDKIIYSLQAQLRVNDVDEAMRGLENTARTMGGYVAGSRQSNLEYGYLTLRIPAETFAAFTDSLPQWGTVTDKYIFTDDVTEQYMDAESRLKSWQAQEDRYLEFFAAAETVEEMIMIEGALSEVRREKESLEGQIKYWDSKVAYSEVNLELTQKRAETAVTDPWQPVSWNGTLEAAKNAVVKTVSVVWNGLNSAVILLGYALPVLIVLALAALGLRVGLRRRKARRQAALAAAVPPEQPAE
ncbi:MAG: DUF4349 domain-containing protein [Gracilibacteraceae bacterium]|jgi:hypothetical protein|nr:DUF4349 domain-containing protein [Gracilibacteraceae bacterium]